MMDFFNFAEQAMPPAPRKLEVIYTRGFAESMSPDDLIETRLTKYLEYETWTPEQGAYLINGIDAVTVNHPHYCGKIASLADGEIIQNPQYHLDWANVVLTKWKQRENPPAKVRPIDFIVWCKTQGIDTGWVTNADEWPDYVQRQRQSISDHEKIFEEIERRHHEQYETDPEYRAKCVAEQVKRNAEQEQREAEEAKERNEIGRYTLEEAARYIANNSKSIFNNIYKGLKESAIEGDLPVYLPDRDERHKKCILGWREEAFWNDLNRWLEKNETRINYRFPEPEASVQSERPATKKIEVDPIFSQFPNLRANEISVVVMKNNTATILIRGQKITTSPNQLGLKVDSQGWKLIEGAAVCSGDLTNVLERLNSGCDLDKEKSRIKTAISRLRNCLKDSMGLIDDPISEYSKNGSYKFSFKTMGHEDLNGGNISKGADAMDYLADEEFNESEHRNNNGFWRDDE
jgi:hypothetical protein